MRAGQNIWLEGERELYLNMQRVMGSNLTAARQGIREGAMVIVNDAKENLRGNHSVVTGQLRASGRVQAVQDDPDAVDAGFFSEGQGYAAFVEYGRRAGKMPPVDFIIQWFRKKFGMDEKEARARGWASARAIARKGTKPHPFFAPAVEKNKKAISEAIKKAISNDINKNGK